MYLTEENEPARSSKVLTPGSFSYYSGLIYTLQSSIFAESKSMTLNNILPSIQQLSIAEKLQLISFLVEDIKLPLLKQVGETSPIYDSKQHDKLAQKKVTDLLSYKQAISQSKATDKQIDTLAKEVKSGYWESIKGRFEDQEGFEEFFEPKKV